MAIAFDIFSSLSCRRMAASGIKKLNSPEILRNDYAFAGRHIQQKPNAIAMQPALTGDRFMLYSPFAF